MPALTNRAGLTMALALAAWLAPAGAAAQTGEPVGAVQTVEGAVTVLRGGERETMTEGAPIYRQDRIATSGRARLRLRFDDGSVLAIGPGTVVEVSDYAADEGALDATLSLFLGIIRATVAGQADSADVDVTTQAAVASVRSTTWTVEVGEDPHTAVFVVEGAVTVAGRAGGEVVLEAGEGTDVEIGRPPSDPVEWGAPRVRRSLALTDLR